MGAPDSPVRHRKLTVQCPVRHHVTQLLGFWCSWSLAPLSSCGTGQSSGTPDSPVPLWLAAQASVAHCVALFILSESTVTRWIVVARWFIGQSGGTPDSPVNYSGARMRFPESGCMAFVRPWCTGQSGAPDHSTLKFLLLLLNWVPNLNIYWIVLNLCAPVVHEFLTN
jgi:hypothetical protein